MTRKTEFLTKSAPIPGFVDAEKYDQLDVRDEEYRTYVFSATKAYRIDFPILVAVKKGPNGHSHRVLDRAGQCHYIPKGWIAIYWPQPETAIRLPDLSDEADGIDAAFAEDESQGLGEVDTSDLGSDGAPAESDPPPFLDDVVALPPSEAQDAAEELDDQGPQDDEQGRQAEASGAEAD